MTLTTHLLIIDPQNDFCDLPEPYCPINPALAAGADRPARLAPALPVPGAHADMHRLAPALPVPGAHADMQRLAQFIRGGGEAIDAITVTLDSHHRLDIAHPGFWRTAAGGAVAPFTPITAAHARAGEFSPRQASALPRTLAYLEELDARGRYTLMVWPVHCEIGSWGHNVHADVRAAYNAWEERTLRSVAKVIKGANPWTEHYSAVQAEVPDAADAQTQINRALLGDLARADVLLIAGEASSHCVKASAEHIVAHLATRPGAARPRIVLLTDCMSPVAGFEAQQTQFFEAMRAQGVVLARSGEVLTQGLLASG